MSSKLSGYVSLELSIGDKVGVLTLLGIQHRSGPCSCEVKCIRRKSRSKQLPPPPPPSQEIKAGLWFSVIIYRSRKEVPLKYQTLKYI